MNFPGAGREDGVSGATSTGFIEVGDSRLQESSMGQVWSAAFVIWKNELN